MLVGVGGVKEGEEERIVLYAILRVLSFLAWEVGKILLDLALANGICGTCALGLVVIRRFSRHLRIDGRISGAPWLFHH